MNVRFERDLSHNYVVPEWRDDFCEESYQIHMLTENKISGLLTCSVKNMNGKIEYYYDITSRESLKQKYETEYMKEDDILCIMRALHQMLGEISKYLLDENCILLDPELIFINEDTKEVGFTYIPNFKGNIAQSYRKLSEYILHHLDQMDSNAVILGYDLFRESTGASQGLGKILEKTFLQKAVIEQSENPNPYVEKRENYFPIEEENKEEKEKSEYSAKSKREVTQENRREKHKRETAKSRKKKIEKEKINKKINKKQKQNKGSVRIEKDIMIVSGMVVILFFIIVILIYKNILTMTQGGGITFLMVGIFGYILTEGKKGKKKRKEDPFKIEKRLEKERIKREETATTVLWDGEEEYEEKLSLISLNSRDGQNLVLQKDVYLIGKMRSKVDFFLDDPAVSRVHAKLEKRNGDYYIQDMHSTNGTYVNGKRLEEEECVKLEFADEITFAQCGYYVGKC